MISGDGNYLPINWVFTERHYWDVEFRIGNFIKL